MKNFDDGVAARYHPHLMRPATEDEADDLRIAINLNADDIEVCNPLGTARGEHKECGIQAANLNLPAEERFKEGAIMLIGLAKAKVYKAHGMCRVLAGVDDEGEEHDEENICADFRKLHRGRLIMIPGEKTNLYDEAPEGFRSVRLKVYVILFSGDYLGAQSVLPFIESPSAHHFCRGCDYDSRSPMAGRPFSFLKAPPRGEKRAFAERDWPTLQTELNRLRKGVTAAELRQKYHDLGLNKLYYALDPDYLPFVDPVKIAPQDLLHLFPDGLLRSELAWLIYVLCRLGFSLSSLNARIRSYRGLPDDVRIPQFPDKLRQGEAGGKPKSKSTARMTGSQCMHFALHSTGPQGILYPLLTAEMRANPAWHSWVKLVELFTLAAQHELHVDDIERIDDLVLDHSARFDCVPEYNGFKRPKHHFCSHLALDAWRFGPPRGYWCFGFEHFNQRIKKGANASNWKNTTTSVMRYWSAWSARLIMRLGFV